jgi:hypothetical protein
MLPSRAAWILFLLFPAAAATLPELRTEPTAGGSIFIVKNNDAQPLAAFLLELVDYPGSSYSFVQDSVASTLIPPSGERQFKVANMTAGAVPEYMKMQAAIYADGSSSGTPEKIAQLLEHRRTVLGTTRELIKRIEKAKADGTQKPALTSALKEWSNSLAPAKSSREPSLKDMNNGTARALIIETSRQIDAGSLDEVLTSLRTSERDLAGSKPAL